MNHLLRLCAVAVLLTCSTLIAQSVCSDTPAPQYFKALTDGNGARYPLTIGPVSWKLLGENLQPVKGSDGMVHLAYVMMFTNSWGGTATIKSIEVVDPARNNSVTGHNHVLSNNNDEIGPRLRLLSLPITLGAANYSADLPSGQSAIGYFDVTYAEGSQVPRAIAHRVTVNAQGRDKKPKDFIVLSPPLPVNCTAPIVLGPPLKGAGWVDGNGCCKEIGPHRFVINSINGSLASTEMYAIDWMQVNSKGEMFSGDSKVNKNWLDYGAELIAVAPGTVVEVMTDVPDGTPGKAPDDLTIEQIAGNRVILDLGSNIYAEYDHLIPGSATVHVGEHVTTGQKVGLLGNSGNSDAPHLHFQLMDRPSSLDGSALPFVFESMEVEGTVPLSLAELDATIFSKPLKVEGTAKKPMRVMPLSRDVVSFK